MSSEHEWGKKRASLQAASNPAVFLVEDTDMIKEHHGGRSCFGPSEVNVNTYAKSTNLASVSSLVHSSISHLQLIV